MIIEIDTSKPAAIDWGATGAEEVAQNVLTLIKTLKYEVAYDRTLGLDVDFIDKPLPEAVSLITAQIYAVIDEREPRAEVLDVQFVGVNDEGNLSFKVAIDV